MSLRKTKTTAQEREAQNRLASVQQFIARLCSDFENSGFRPNRIVMQGLRSSLETIDGAVELLAGEDYSGALKLGNVAFLRAYFARSILDAEMTEHYLGESNFLELDGGVDDWEDFVSQQMKEMEEDVVNLRKEIANGLS